MIMLIALSFVMAQEIEIETPIDTDVNQDIQVPSDVEELPEFVEIGVWFLYDTKDNTFTLWYNYTKR